MRVPRLRPSRGSRTSYPAVSAHPAPDNSAINGAPGQNNGSPETGSNENTAATDNAEQKSRRE